MNDLRELYQQLILDHARAPRNHGKLDGATHTAEGHNPLCGDRLVVYLDLQQGKIARVRFEGSGCAISLASASLMTEAVTSLSLDDSERLFEEFHALVTGRSEPDAARTRLRKLVAFAGVRAYPVRVKCATLPWHTLRAASRGADVRVTTE